MRVAHRFPRCSLSLSLSPSRPAPSLLPPRPLPARCSHCQHFAPKYARAAAEVSATHPEVQFHAVSCVAHGALCRDQNVTGYPTVRVYRGGSYEGRRWGGGDDAVGILRELGIGDGSSDGGAAGDGVGEGRTGGGRTLRKVGTKDGPPPPPQKSEPRRKSTEKKEKGGDVARVVPFRPNDVHDAWSDAALSFEFALRNGIYVENGPLDPGRGRAFREWLTLLSKTLPPQMKRTLDVVDAVLSDFPRAAGGQGGLDALVRERVGGFEGGTADGGGGAPARTWRTCTYGDGDVGYTCGLWQLFHVVSVGAVEYNRNNPPMPTRYVADTLRNCECASRRELFSIFPPGRR